MKRLTISMAEKFPVYGVLFDKGNKDEKKDVMLFGLKEERGNTFYLSEQNEGLETLLTGMGMTKCQDTDFRFSPTQAMMEATSNGVNAVFIGLPFALRSTMPAKEFTALMLDIMERF